jgi:hypothetical protein
MSSGSYTARTRLAWRRTVLLGALSTVLLIRMAVERDAGWLAVAAGAAWLVLAVAGQLRIRRLTADGTAPAGTALTVAVAVAVGYAVIGAAAAALIS